MKLLKHQEIKTDIVLFEMQDLKQKAREYLENSKAENTKKAYRTDWQQFKKWCDNYSFQALPAKPEVIIYYITYLAKTMKVSTIKRKMAAISQRHETSEFKSPTKTAIVRGVWNGLQREKGVKEIGKDALWLRQLREILKTIPKDRLIGVRNRALLVIGWSGALRRSEIVSLNIDDISKTNSGLIIQLNKSKTDQKGEGQVIAIPYGSNQLTCPVRSFEDWINASKITEGAVFRRIDRHGNLLERLTPQSVRLIVKSCSEKAGLDSNAFGAHSLRSGFCSQAAKSGKSEHQIMKQTRHKRLDSLYRYIKADLFESNAAKDIGL